MTRIAGITLGPDGYAVELTDVPLRWLAADRAAEAFMGATGHLLCCNLPGWTYRVRWGPRDEESGLADRSLGHLLYEAGQRLGMLSFRHETRKVTVPVSAEWVGEHYPEVRAEFGFLEHIEDTGPDAMSVTFGGPEPGSDEALAAYQEASNEIRELTGNSRPHRTPGDTMLPMTATEIEVPPGHGLLHTLDRDGDQRVMWDRGNADEVDAARRTFRDLTRKGYLAFKAEGKRGDQGEQIREFDPDAERIILAKPPVGG